jgi:metal-sulfur cluster biosynthetic enzyme/rhodanese-related sulfurtransferase
MWLLLGGLAVVFGVVAVSFQRRLSALDDGLSDVRMLRREVEALRGEFERGLALTRTHVAQVAAGEAPPRDVIVHGKAFQDIQSAPAQVLYEQTPALFVLDVRTEAEYNNGHIPRATLIPLDELEDRLKELPAKDTPMLVTCAAGGRSMAACETLGEHGYTRLLNLVGGMHAWTGPRDRDPAAPVLPPPPTGSTATRINERGGEIGGAQVVAAIRQCFDPEIPLNVYDLGLIYDIDIDPAAIAVKMTLTSESCPSARSIPEDVKKKIVALGQPNVSVEVVFDPPWHPALISAEGKDKLGLH